MHVWKIEVLFNCPNGFTSHCFLEYCSENRHLNLSSNASYCLSYYSWNRFILTVTSKQQWKYLTVKVQVYMWTHVVGHIYIHAYYSIHLNHTFKWDYFVIAWTLSIFQIRKKYYLCCNILWLFLHDTVSVHHMVWNTLSNKHRENFS